MSRRWVVVSEENFTQLCDRKKLENQRKQTETKAHLENAASSENKEHYKTTDKINTSPNQIEEIAKPLHTEEEKINFHNPPEEKENNFTQESLPINSENTKQAETPPNSPKPNRSLDQVIPEHKIIENLPLSYRQCAVKLLRTLNETNEFTADDEGQIFIKNNKIPNYSVEQFLRATCIPFSKADIPLLLQSWLKEKGITKFRNHLARIRPDWVNKYGSRASTMGRGRGHSAVP